MSNDKWRKTRKVTITQSPTGFRVENDFGSEEVSDTLMIFAMGLRGMALSIAEQTNADAEAVIGSMSCIALQSIESSHTTRHLDDETGEISTDEEMP